MKNHTFFISIWKHLVFVYHIEINNIISLSCVWNSTNRFMSIKCICRWLFPCFSAKKFKLTCKKKLRIYNWFFFLLMMMLLLFLKYIKSIFISYNFFIIIIVIKNNHNSCDRLMYFKLVKMIITADWNSQLISIKR